MRRGVWSLSEKAKGQDDFIDLNCMDQEKVD